jgi:hypothetical protein
MQIVPHHLSHEVRATAIPRFTTLSQTMLREDSHPFPSQLSGRSREACPPTVDSTWHGHDHAATCACAHRLSGGSRAVPRLCPGHAVSGSTPQRLNNCQRKQLLPCQPLSQRQSLRACYACITRGITRGNRAKIAKMRDRKPPRNDRHQSTSHSSRSFSNHADPVLARAHQRPSSVPTLPSSQRLPASRGFTNHSTIN